MMTTSSSRVPKTDVTSHFGQLVHLPNTSKQGQNTFRQQNVFGINGNADFNIYTSPSSIIEERTMAHSIKRKRDEEFRIAETDDVRPFKVTRTMTERQFDHDYGNANNSLAPLASSR